MLWRPFHGRVAACLFLTNTASGGHRSSQLSQATADIPGTSLSPQLSLHTWPCVRLSKFKFMVSEPHLQVANPEAHRWQEQVRLLTCDSHLQFLCACCAPFLSMKHDSMSASAQFASFRDWCTPEVVPHKYPMGTENPKSPSPRASAHLDQ